MVGLPPLKPERQRERLAALDRIGCHLDTLGEPAWHGVIVEWLHHLTLQRQFDTTFAR